MVLFYTMTKSAEQSTDFPSTWPLESSLVIVTGTHSSGKSTLVSGIEQGKLAELGDNYPFTGNRYADDLGYGMLDSPDGQRFVITVPETARWLAEEVGRPDLLAENYSLTFQYDIDALATYRIGAAVGATSSVMEQLMKQGLLEFSDIASKPLIVSDRGPLDGVIYSTERIHDRDTNLMDGYPRAGSHAEWTRQAASLVIVSDDQDVPFEKDAARLDDNLLRQEIARRILLNYGDIMPEDSLVVVSGNADERLAETKRILGSLHRFQKGIRLPLSEDQQAAFKLK